MNIEERIKELETELANLKKQVIYPIMIKIPDRSYEVSETPITVAQFRTFCEATNREFPIQPNESKDNYPVVNVSWHDAMEYCEWLSEVTGDSYDLPTEDEFEHFCGDHTEANEEIAVYSQTSIQPVKTKKPNKYGLYDVLGLVWEWSKSNY